MIHIPKDGCWHIATPENTGASWRDLEAALLGAGWAVAADAGGRVLARHLIGSERAFARDPRDDGFTLPPGADQLRPTRRRGAPAKYPWDRWTDGRWHFARQGTHFTISSESFVAGLRVRATRSKLRIKVKILQFGRDQRDPARGHGLPCFDWAEYAVFCFYTPNDTFEVDLAEGYPLSAPAYLGLVVDENYRKVIADEVLSKINPELYAAEYEHLDWDA